MAQLVHVFPDTEVAMKFIESFFVTEAREWNGIDRWRMDKFMMVWHKAKKIFVFLVRQPTLIFCPDPKLFYGTFLCCMRSIVAHSDHFVLHLSVRLSLGLSHFLGSHTCIPRNAATILMSKGSLFWLIRVKCHSWSVEMHSSCHRTSIQL